MAAITSNKRSIERTIKQQSDDLREVERAAWGIALVVIGFIVVLSIGSAFDEETVWSGVKVLLRTLSISVATATAAAAVGSMLGFLFGIPRLLQRAQEPSKPGDQGVAEGTKPFFSTNTSLEEISDWLTKIIIGIGLVQFETIIHYIYVCSMFAASYVRSAPMTIPVATDSFTVAANLSVSFFFAIIIICLLGACLFIYLETRTRFTRIFRQVEADNLSSAPTIDYEVSLDTPLSLPIAPTPPGSPETKQLSPLTSADKKLVNVPWEELTTATELGGWASAQARAGNAQPAEDALRDALKREPDNHTLLLRLAELRRSRSNTSGFVETSVELVRKSVDRTEATISLLESALLQALYLPQPNGFSQAIILSDFLLADPGYKKPMTLIRRACAFGQKFAVVKDADAKTAQEVRNQALNAVKTVVDMLPDPSHPDRVLLKQLLDPKTYGGYPKDNDLEVFKDDPDFRKLILSE